MIAGIPEASTTKGLFFNRLQELARKRGVPFPDDHYVGLLDYSSREYCGLLVDIASALYPEETLREALRRVGHTAFPTLRSGLVGRAVFAVFGKNPRPPFRLMARGWQMSTSHVRAREVERGPSHAIIEVVDCYAFLDSYVVGIFEGVLLDRELQPEVTLEFHGPSSCMYHCAWT